MTKQEILSKKQLSNTLVAFCRCKNQVSIYYEVKTYIVLHNGNLVLLSAKDYDEDQLHLALAYYSAFK